MAGLRNPIGRIVSVLALLAAAAGLSPAWAQAARPPITDIARVSVFTASPARSQAFYGGLLGFPRDRSSSRPGSRVYWVGERQSIQVDPLPPGTTDFLECVAFATTNAPALRRYLESRRVVVSQPVEADSGGARHFRVLDPEGHCIEFIQSDARQQNAAGREGGRPVSTHILHAGFIVHDRAAEDHFYRDILGFREGWHGGMKSGKTDWVDMQVPDGTDWVEYMLHDSSPVSAHTSGVLNHFALGVVSVQRAAGLLEQRGWHSSAEQKPQIGRDGKWQLNLYDADGTRVELMEFSPVRTPCCSAYRLRRPDLPGRQGK